MFKIYRSFDKPIIVYGKLKSNKDYMFYYCFSKRINKLRFHSRFYIQRVVLSYGRYFKNEFYIYHLYTTLLIFKKWYQRPFYTLKKHCRIYSDLCNITI